MSSWGILAFLAGSAMGGPSAGFPETSPDEKDALRVALGEVGRWERGPEGLRVVEGAAVGDQWWLSALVPFSDGFVRAKVKVGKSLDTGILFRMRPGDDDREMSGYGLMLSGTTVTIQRYDEGVAVPITSELTVAGLSGHREIEVALFLAGPMIGAFLYDGESLVELGSITARDSSYAQGTVGVRGGDEPDGAMVRSLTVVSGDREGVLGPLADLRRVVIAEADLSKLPADLKGLVVKTEEGKTHLVATPEQSERIRRSSANVLEEDGNVTWWHQDPVYRGHRGKAPVAVGKGFRIDGYKDAAMVEAMLKAWNLAYPKVTTLQTIGTSALGTPIWALKISDNAEKEEADEPAILLNGAHHGSELLSTDYALDTVQEILEKYGSDERVTRWVNGAELWVVPLVNPDGNQIFTTVSKWGGRKNGRDVNSNGRLDAWDGVDLNRNYPTCWGCLGEKGSRSWRYHYTYRGPAAATEPEVQAVMALANREVFEGVISFHTAATSVLSPYSIDGLVNADPDIAWKLAEKMVGASGKQPNGKTYKVRRKLYSVDGTDQDWHFQTHGSLAYVVEGTHHNPKNPDIRRQSILGVRPIWQTFLDELVAGPRIWGHVRDQAGNPVTAEVKLSAVKLSQGETWRSRPRDGRYDRYVGAPGTWEVVVQAPGYAPARKSVVVAEDPVKVEFVLSPAPE